MRRAIKPAALTLAAFAAGIIIGLAADARANGGGGHAPAALQVAPGNYVAACIIAPNDNGGGWIAYHVYGNDNVIANHYGSPWPLSAYLQHNPQCQIHDSMLLRWAKQQAGGP